MPQVVFSSGLMLGSFKGMDHRRADVMRQIQECHRQTLIQELQAVIQQKDCFMSSVSHELRTPLNGIIGAPPRRACCAPAALACHAMQACLHRAPLHPLAHALSLSLPLSFSLAPPLLPHHAQASRRACWPAAVAC